MYTESKSRTLKSKAEQRDRITTEVLVIHRQLGARDLPCQSTLGVNAQCLA
jgi:hypothetical protein